MADDEAGAGVPIDRSVLELLRDRLRTTRQVADAHLSDEAGHIELLITLSEAYYPGSETNATLTIRWYTNDDFSIHYREAGGNESWECRWDRHPNPHNDREHFHPPPDAATPGEDGSWPNDYREVVRLVLDDIENRIEERWRG
ncbi:hypothetical protein [Haloglomus halophilum]|uniref:hypothetical protein n=1 Tax=Haloglomus halophilum TaxID=2962672 RepID=UPI0020C9DD16|nr:hypothetical protein [Haloglomus halophilum]